MTSIDVDIEKIVAGGDGLARHEGRVVFVPATAPGERHRVEIVQQKKDYLRAQSVVCLEPSRSRRQAPCPHFGSCGGCSLMHIDLESQLAAKRAVLLESLERKGVPTSDVPLALARSPETGYRTRLRFHVASGASPDMGFHRRGSRIIEDVPTCQHASDGLSGAWSRMRGIAAAQPELVRGVVSIELQESTPGGRIVGHFLVRSRDDLRRFDHDVVETLGRRSALAGLVVSTGSRGVQWGEPFVHHVVGGVSLRQSVGAFFQTNRCMLERLVAAATPSQPIARLVDFYCGVGLFSISLAAHASEIVGVETSSVTVRDARFNAEAAGVDHARFIQADVSRFASEFRFRADDYVVADPPRGGLARVVSDALARSALQRLSYVSCDPPALGRDAARLREHGLRLVRLELLDLFPNTHHFETVATFARSPLDPAPRAG